MKIFLICFCLCSILSLSNAQVEELGKVKWLRDLDLAQNNSKSSHKPILILFQEIPGCSTCKNYGNNVLSHPLIVEAIETYFVPLAIHNNKKGKDTEVLNYFQEPAWNNPVVRIVDASLKDKVDRLNGNYTNYGLVSKMITALISVGVKPPEYLKLMEEEFLSEAQGTEVATFGMYCFWSGEKNYGKMNGVVGTKAGYMNGSEVVEVEYNPKVININQLIENGQKVSCADKIYVDKNQSVKINTQIDKKTLSNFRLDPELKYYIYNSDYKYIPMTKLQATRINSALAFNQNPDSFLSPAQLNLLKNLKSNPKLKKKNFIGGDISKDWIWN